MWNWINWKLNTVTKQLTCKNFCKIIVTYPGVSISFLWWWGIRSAQHSICWYCRCWYWNTQYSIVHCYMCHRATMTKSCWCCFLQNNCNRVHDGNIMKMWPANHGSATLYLVCGCNGIQVSARNYKRQKISEGWMHCSWDEGEAYEMLFTAMYQLGYCLEGMTNMPKGKCVSLPYIELSNYQIC